MKVLFRYWTADGDFILPLEVDGNRPFNTVVNDAHEIAAEHGLTAEQFITCDLPHLYRRNPKPVTEIVMNPEAMDELRRIGSIEKL